MKRLFISVTILTFLGAPQFALGSDEDDLTAANHKLFQAWSSLDAETVASLISPGAVGYHLDEAFPLVGPMESTHAERTEYMKTFFQNFELLSMNPYNLQSRVFENTGIVWGHVSITVKEKGVPRLTWHLRYTSTWIKSDGQWHMIMNHYSVIPYRELRG